MTPYEMDYLDQERCELQQAAAEAMYIDGAEDATCAKLPSCRDRAYLDGYINGLDTLPTHPDGSLCYAALRCPRRMFCTCEEF